MAATHNPPEDFVAWLTGRTVNARVLAVGTNLFARSPTTTAPGVPTFPAKCIFVWSSTGGMRPTPHMGTPGTATSIFRPRLQVRVRGEPGIVQEPRRTARDLMQLIQETRKINSYMSMLVNESEPIDLGDLGYGFNIDMIFSE